MQLNLPFTIDIEYGADNFIVSSCNFDAYHAVNSSNWFNNRMMIIGSKGAGKTHLCQIWAQKANAIFIDNSFQFDSSCNLIVQNIEQYDEEFLFHVINHCHNNNNRLLMTNERFFHANLVDLKSRISATQCYMIEQPDYDLLKLVLIKHFSDMQINVPLNVIDYSLRHLRRDFDTIRQFAYDINNLSISQKRNITLPFIKQYLIQNGHVTAAA